MAKRFRKILNIVLCTLFVLAIIWLTCFKIIRITSESMEPTLMTGDLYVSFMLPITVDRGDIVVFENHAYSSWLVKRVIGLPGDILDIKDGKVSVNGVELSESYVALKDNYNGHFEVPSKEYLLMGDNRNFSYDGRYWDYNYTRRDEIKGRVIKID